MDFNSYGAFFSFSFTSILLLPIISFLFYCYVSISRRPDGGNKTTRPNSYPIIGNVIGVLRNYHRMYDYVTELFSKTGALTIQVDMFLGLSHVVATVDPANVEHVLKTNFRNYIKGSYVNSNLFDLLGHGIFNADSELWSLQRKIASHEFNTKSLKSFISRTVRSEISDRLLPYLFRACDDEGREVDLQMIFEKFTFDNICNLAFGVDPACLDAAHDQDSSKSTSSSKMMIHSHSAFAQAFDAAAEICFFRFLWPLPLIWKVKRFLNIGSEKRLKEAVKVIDNYATDVIKTKEKKLLYISDSDHERDQDLLSRFMHSGSVQLDFDCIEEKRKFYRDIVVSFILAGRDTTASALTWFFWVMAGHPQCEHMIYDEISSTMAEVAKTDGGDNYPTYDELKSFHYLHAALSESMRLFPPVPFNTRLAVNDDTLPDGTHLRKGWKADYSAYAMGRMESIWGPDCREFKPERWLDRDGAYQPFDQFKYPVFHCGPRICLGKEMAYVQMKSVAASLIYNFEITAVDGGGTPEKMVNPPYNISLLLKMKNGLRVKLRRRTNKST
ncbi:hypothetical protein Dimus_011771 [Dionaea muscipula]